MTFGQLALRGTVGPFFIGHGTQKLFGWFGGHGLEGTSGFFESQLSLRPGKRHATAAGVAEAAGGALLALGALTPLASALLSGAMVTAIRKVHASNGPWVTDSGFEYNVVLLAALASITSTGPGRPSVDAAAFPRLKGSLLAAGALAAGAAGSFAATELFSGSPEPDGAADGPDASAQTNGVPHHTGAAA